MLVARQANPKILCILLLCHRVTIGCVWLLSMFVMEGCVPNSGSMNKWLEHSAMQNVSFLPMQDPTTLVDCLFTYIVHALLYNVQSPTHCEYL